MSLLTQLWQQYPDMRLNQLCHFVASKRAVRLKISTQNDLFNLEDDGFLEQLQMELGKKVESVDPYHL